MPRFFTDANLITTLSPVHIQLNQIIASFLTDIESQKSDIMAYIELKLISCYLLLAT